MKKTVIAICVVIVIVLGLVLAERFFSFGIFLTTYLYIAQPNQVAGKSMNPTYPDGAFVMTEKLSYRFDQPQRGDVIIFEPPTKPGFEFIQRIIGTPGDLLKVKSGQVFLNNQPIDETYLPKPANTKAGKFLAENEEITIPNDSYIVMGDNREVSSDSREWGFIPKENIVGKVAFCYAHCE